MDITSKLRVIDRYEGKTTDGKYNRTNVEVMDMTQGGQFRISFNMERLPEGWGLDQVVEGVVLKARRTKIGLMLEFVGNLKPGKQG